MSRRAIEQGILGLIILTLITGTKLFGGAVNVRIYTLVVCLVFLWRIDTIPLAISANSKLWLPLLGFFLAIVISIPSAINPLNTFKQLILVTTFFMIPMTMVAMLYRRPENFRSTVFWLLLGAFIANINGYLDPFYRFKAMGWGGFFGRPQSFFAEGNEYGQFMVMIWGYLVALILLRGAPGKQRLWAILSAMFMFPLFIINNSRGSFLGFILQCLLVSWLIYRSSPLRDFLKVVVSGTLILMLLIGGSFFIASRVPVMFDRTVADIVLERLTSFGTSEDETTQIRVEQQKSGLNAFLEHPVTGTGLGNILYYLNDRSELEEVGGVVKGPTATTAFWFTDLLGETGILGTAAMCIVVFVLIKQAFRNYALARGGPGEHIAAGNFLSLCGMLLNGISYPPIYLAIFWLNVGLCAQISFLTTRGSRDALSPKEPAPRMPIAAA